MNLERSVNKSKHRWLDRYPQFGSGPISADTILSQEHFEKQRDKIFKKVWLQVGRIERIPNPGDYFVAEIAIAKASLIITRQSNGSIGAFHNICMHRGNKLIWDKEGCRKFFACGFHGWVFNNEGTLMDVPDINDFYDLDKKTLGLRKVRVEEWEGFIFVNLDGAGTQGLKEYLGEAGKRLIGYPFARHSARMFYRTDVHSNWQLIADAQAEGYHVPYIHARMVAGDSGGNNVSSEDNPHGRFAHFEALGLHSVLTLPYNPGFTAKGVDRIAGKYGTLSINVDLERDYGLPATMNTGGTNLWTQQIYCFFPNFNLLIQRDSWGSHQMWPVTVDKSVWEVSLGHEPPTTAAGRFTQEQFRCFFREVITEDGATHEQSQLALESGILKSFHFKDDEMACRQRYAQINQIISE